MHRQSCLPSGLTVAAPDAFGRIPGVYMDNQYQHNIGIIVYHIAEKYLVHVTYFQASEAKKILHLQEGEDRHHSNHEYS